MSRSRSHPNRRRAAALGVALFCASLPASAQTAGPSLLEAGRAPSTDDLDGLVARRELRALVAHARTDYEVVKGKQQGIVFSALQDLERRLNDEFAPAGHHKKKGKRLPVRLTIVPVSYGELFDKLLAGEGDFIASPLLVTEAAAQRVTFTDSFYDEAELVVVTRAGDVLPDGPKALSGRVLHLRQSSGAWQHLLAANRVLEASGLPPAVLRAADEHLSDDELLEMVDAGLVPATVTFRFRARLWSQVFEHLHVNEHAPVAQHQHLALAVRPGNPKLLAWLNRFVKTRKTGTKLANIERGRYLRAPAFALKSLDDEAHGRFQALNALFFKYGERYQVDHLLLLAQGYQESGLRQEVRSHTGAVGVMQVMPATGKALKVGDVRQLEPNVHAGAKYLHQLRTRYFDEPGLAPADRLYLSFAAYNAGPGNVHRARKAAVARGLDPNRWFDHVERVMLEQVGLEPVRYVANITKYYLAYRHALASRGASTARAP